LCSFTYCNTGTSLYHCDDDVVVVDDDDDDDDDDYDYVRTVAQCFITPLSATTLM